MLERFTRMSLFSILSVLITNMITTQGLTFRASIKTKRSITSWRDKAPTLPRSTQDFRDAASAKAAGVFGAAGSVFTNVTGNSHMSEKEQLPSGASNVPSNTATHGGYGFGRQGEKHAGLKGELP